MALGSLSELYLAELSDLYAAESQSIRVLPWLAEAARAPELRDVLAKHAGESRLHLERLQLILMHWGQQRAPSQTCAGMAGIVQEADDRLNQHATEDVRDAAIVGIAQRIEHYEIAAYTTARTYARQLSRPDEARLLQETLDDEGRSDRRLAAIAESHINDDARWEPDTKEEDTVNRNEQSPDVDVAGPAEDVAGPTPDTVESPVLDGQHPVSREPRAGDESMTPPHGDILRSELP
jgi:ferritin-like metal-binding protein YciE